MFEIKSALYCSRQMWYRSLIIVVSRTWVTLYKHREWFVFLQLINSVIIDFKIYRDFQGDHIRDLLGRSFPCLA